METWRYGYTEIQIHGDMEIWRHGNTETRRQGDTETETRRHGDTDATWSPLSPVKDSYVGMTWPMMVKVTGNVRSGNEIPLGYIH